MSLMVLAFLGFVRECFQHDLRLTFHQTIEAVAWPAGGALVWLGWSFV
jgi:hypothetical protein